MFPRIRKTTSSFTGFIGIFAVLLAFGAGLTRISIEARQARSARSHEVVSPLPPSVSLPLSPARTSLLARRRVVEGYGKLPLSFERNQGQVDAQVKYLARGPGYTLFLTADEAVLALQKEGRQEVENSRDRKISKSRDAAVLRMKLAGANPARIIAGEQELPGRSNYFLGNDASQWHRNVPQNARVVYRDVYPGVDLAFHGQNGQLEFDFVVAPRADPQRIRLQLNGARQLRLDNHGDLVLSTGEEKLRFRKPFVYQETPRGRQEVAGGYQLLGKNQVGFVLAPYDEKLPLIIDPTLVYSTYLGGNINDFGNGIAVDGQGNVYLVGNTDSTNFPAVKALQPVKAFADDVFVVKLNASGSAIVFSTFLGGNGIDFGNGIALDTAGDVYLVGTTNSTNFPTSHPFQATRGFNQNAFVAKLSGDGSALVYSTYLGGGFDAGNAIAVDAQGSAYVTGTTLALTFPTVQAIQPTTNSFRTPDAFVTKFTPAGDALVFSTYLGGSSSDSGLSIAVDTAGSAYVTGRTSSSDFPAPNSIQPFGGAEDVFVTKFSAAGDTLAYSTYLGGSNQDAAFGVAVDSAGNAYVAGVTTSPDFPTRNPVQPVFGGAVDAFVAKLNAAGTDLVYSTYVGGSTSDNANGIAVDSSGNAYVAGETDSSDFPMNNAIQPSFQGWADGFVTVLNAAGSAFVLSTYLGGSGGFDACLGIAVDTAGNVYVSGRTDSPDFLVQNPIQATLAGARDAFVAKISGALGVTNHPPVLTVPGPQTVPEGQTLTFAVSATDADNDPLIIAVQSASLPAGASFDPASQTFSWTPGFDVSTMHIDSFFDVFFDVSDGRGGMDTKSVRITVANANRPPVLTVPGPQVIPVGQTLSFAVSATDADGDPLQYSAFGLPAAAGFDPATQTSSWTPGVNQAGNYTIAFTASDGQATDTKTVEVDVTTTCSGSLGPISITGSVQQLTLDPSAQFDPAIAGNYVVYTDLRNANADIYYMNLASGVETRVTYSSADEQLNDISGNTIVWTEYDAATGLGKIMGLTIGGSTFTVSGSPTWNQQNPAVGGSIVAWEDSRNGLTDIFAKDLATGVVKQLTNSPSIYEADPAVWGRRIAFQQRWPNGECHIFVADFDSGVLTQITTAAGCHNLPDIFGDIVVYDGIRNGERDIYVYNLNTSTETRLSLPGVQRNPNVSGDWVAFEDVSSGLSSIRLYHIPSGTLFTAVANGANNYLSDIDGTRIAFSSDVNGPANLDIYLYQFSVQCANQPPVAANQSVTILVDTAAKIQLGASDAEGDPLSFAIVTQPAHGTLSGSAPLVTYMPNFGFTGTDTFTFKANDGQSDSNVATVTIDVLPPPAVPDLALIKFHSGGAFFLGTNRDYTLRVANVGTGLATGPIHVLDSLPQELAFVSAAGTGWVCTAPGQLVDCVHPGPVSPGASMPDITLTVSVVSLPPPPNITQTGGGTPTVVNAAIVQAPGDPNPLNDMATDQTVVVSLPDLTISKHHFESLVAGWLGVFTLTVKNIGSLATSGPITVTDTLPAGLTFVSGTGVGWGCTASGQDVTCTNSGPLAPNASSDLVLTVSVASAAAPNCTNSATVSTPGDGNPANDSTSDPASVITPSGCVTTELISRSRSQAGGVANNWSGGSAISADGRYVAFGSFASDLVPNDQNNFSDVFLFDRQMGKMTRVSTASGGTDADGSSIGRVAINADGRFVVFASDATNLVAGGSAGTNIFVYDQLTKQTTRVSVDSNGNGENGDSSHPSISADGRFVAFASDATNLVSGTPTSGNILLHDRATGQTTLVAAGSLPPLPILFNVGGWGNDYPAISGDGRYVAFSRAALLVGGPSGALINAGGIGIFDRQTGQTVGPSLQQDMDFFVTSMSRDGRFIAYTAGPHNGNGPLQVYLADWQAGQTTKISVSPNGADGDYSSVAPMISADGAFVAFSSQATNLVPNDTNGDSDVFLFDRQAGTIRRVSADNNGAPGNGGSGAEAISADGRFVSFLSYATNFAPGDTNGVSDVFVRDTQCIPPNLPPVASDVSVSVNQNASASASLTASDPNGDPLTFKVLSQPTNGTLSGTAPNLTYTPNLNFNGTDSFTFQVNDGQADSNVATVTITVNLGTAIIVVNESISVQDFPVALPSALLNVNETIVVNDTAAPLPSAMFTVNESIAVLDSPVPLPSAMLNVSEAILVQDAITIENTPAGSNVTVTPVAAATGTSPVTLVFSSVTQPGLTTLTISTTGPPTPAGFQLGSPPVYFDLTTTAVFAGNITVCINFTGISFSGSPVINHFENGKWVALLPTTVNPATQTACALATSLSPFALFVPTNVSPVANAGPDQTVEATSPAGAMVTLNGAASSDPDGDPLSYSWTGPFGTLLGMIVTPTLPLGTHTITLTVNDGRGGIASDTVQVTVRDTTPPAVTPPTNLTVPATESGGARGSAAAALAAFLAGGSASDLVDPAPTRLPPQVNNTNVDNTTLFPLGTSTVVFRFADASGNIGTATASVTVAVGTPRLAGRVLGKGRDAAGNFYVDVQLSNTGTGHARNLKISQIALRTLSGSGTVSYDASLSPTLPLSIGSLDVGSSTTVRFFLNVPSTVTKFSITENGTLQDVVGTGYSYSVAQAVYP